MPFRSELLGNRTPALLPAILIFIAGGYCSAQTTRPHAMTLHVVDQSSHPIPGVTVKLIPMFQADLDHHKSMNDLPFTTSQTDGSGTTQAAFLDDARLVYLRASKDGWVPKAVQWSTHVLPSRTSVVPARYFPSDFTITTEPGTTIGGIVQDENGQPIPGVTVDAQNTFPFQPARPYDISQTAQTDSAGRWHIDSMPSVLGEVIFDLTREGYSYPSPQEEQPEAPPAEKLRDRSAVFVMHPPVTLTGFVRDMNNRPVVGADVTVGEAFAQSRPSNKTDAGGRFQIAGLSTGSKVVTVVAPAFAPILTTIDVRSNQDPVTIKLSPPNTLTGRVVDDAGRSIAGANIGVSSLGDRPSRIWQSQTDANGRFTWSAAPSGNVGYSVYKSGYLGVYELTLKAGPQPVVVTLHAALQVHGTVTDADTGKPIDAIAVVPGFSEGADDPPFWDSGSRHFTAGKYEVIDDSSRAAHFFRFEADGYEPQVSRAFKDGENNVELNVQLHRAKSAAYGVQTPDGKPANGAMVLLLSPGRPVVLLNNRLDPNFRPIVTNPDSVIANAKGEFKIPPDIRPSELLVLHDDGFARLLPAQLSQTPTVRLSAWSAVTGIVTIDGKPAAGQKVEYQPHPPPPQGNGFPVTKLYFTSTDSSGRFLLDRIEPGNGIVCLAVGVDKESLDGASAYIELKKIFTVDGETAIVDIKATKNELKAFQ